MMLTPSLKTLPGKQISLKLSGTKPALTPLTTATGSLPFHIVKRLLNDKPLTRPNRNRPVDKG